MVVDFVWVCAVVVLYFFFFFFKKSLSSVPFERSFDSNAVLLIVVIVVIVVVVDDVLDVAVTRCGPSLSDDGAEGNDDTATKTEQAKTENSNLKGKC